MIVAKVEKHAKNLPWQISRVYSRLLTLPVLFLFIFFFWPLTRVVVRFVDRLGLNYAEIFSAPFISA
jgi:hypothetical protein